MPSVSWLHYEKLLQLCWAGPAQLPFPPQLLCLNPEPSAQSPERSPRPGGCRGRCTHTHPHKELGQMEHGQAGSRPPPAMAAVLVPDASKSGSWTRLYVVRKVETEVQLVFRGRSVFSQPEA